MRNATTAMTLRRAHKPRTTSSSWSQSGGWQREVARPDGAVETESFDTLGRLKALAGSTAAQATSWDYQGDFEVGVTSATLHGGPLQKATAYDGLGQACS